MTSSRHRELEQLIGVLVPAPLPDRPRPRPAPVPASDRPGSLSTLAPCRRIGHAACNDDSPARTSNVADSSYELAEFFHRVGPALGAEYPDH